MVNHQHEHARVGSWFLGPRAENFDVLKRFIDRVLEDQKNARMDRYPADGEFISKEMMQTEQFKGSIARLEETIGDLSKKLAKQTIPFWSPRYNAHMNMDTAMSSIIGCELLPGYLWSRGMDCELFS